MLELTYTLETINETVIQFWSQLGHHRLFAFSGEMGAGKTTFIHELCAYLQVEDVVSSPTFALINEYHFTEDAQDRIIYHLDWYRLKSTEEAIDAGMEDCIDQAQRGGTYCFIEWPEKAKELLYAPCLWISIETISLTQRKMTVQPIEN